MQPKKPWDGLVEWFNSLLNPSASGIAPIWLLATFLIVLIALILMAYLFWRSRAKSDAPGG